VFLIKVHQIDSDDPNAFKINYYLETKIDIGEYLQIDVFADDLIYKGHGTFIVNKITMPKMRKLLMLAGGSGIAPLFSICQASVCSKDGLDITLICSHKNKKDILLEELLQQLDRYNTNLKVYYTLSRYDIGFDG